MFHTEYEYECKDAPTKDVYIDPLENFEIIMNAIRGEYKWTIKKYLKSMM